VAYTAICAIQLPPQERLPAYPKYLLQAIVNDLEEYSLGADPCMVFLGTLVDAYRPSTHDLSAVDVSSATASVSRLLVIKFREFTDFRHLDILVQCIAVFGSIFNKLRGLLRGQVQLFPSLAII
jgi:hypothetical protein